MKSVLIVLSSRYVPSQWGGTGDCELAVSNEAHATVMRNVPTRHCVTIADTGAIHPVLCCVTIADTGTGKDDTKPIPVILCHSSHANCGFATMRLQQCVVPPTGGAGQYR